MLHSDTFYLHPILEYDRPLRYFPLTVSWPDLHVLSSQPLSISVCAAHTRSNMLICSEIQNIFYTKPSLIIGMACSALMIHIYLCVMSRWLLRPTVGRFLLTTVSQDLSSQPVKLGADGNLECEYQCQYPVTVDLSTPSLVIAPQFVSTCECLSRVLLIRFRFIISILNCDKEANIWTYLNRVYCVKLREIIYNWVTTKFDEIHFHSSEN